MSEDSAAPKIYLLDANAIIEAVRTEVWNALTGGLTAETVQECADECRQGDTLSTGYVSVSEGNLDRLAAVRSVSDADVASVVLHQASAALDPGERDLVAAVGARPTAPLRRHFTTVWLSAERTKAMLGMP